MGDLFEGWPPEALATLALSSLGNVWLVLKAGLSLWRKAERNDVDLALRGWERVKELDALVALLRRVIDRMRRQANAYATSFELLLVVMPKDPTPEQLRAIGRAEELFETALLNSAGEGDGGAS
jgi:hypothetical protein